MDGDEEDEAESEELCSGCDDVGGSEAEGAQDVPVAGGDEGREDVGEVEEMFDDDALGAAEVDLPDDHLEKECVQQDQLRLVFGTGNKRDHMSKRRYICLLGSHC